MYKHLLLILIALCSSGMASADSEFVQSGIAYKVVADNIVDVIAQKDKKCCYQTFKDSILTVPSCIIHENKEYKVKCIEKTAFSTWCGMKRVVISNGIEEIQDKAFAGCANLESVYIPSSVKSIGTENIFAFCFSLTEITVDDGNTVFDSRNGCNAIIKTVDNSLLCACKSTLIPSTVEKINSYAYTGLQVTSIGIPNGVKTISEYAVCQCKQLEQITISSSVESIAPRAFDQCDNVKSVSVDKNNKYYDSRNNCNAIIEDKEMLIWGCSTTKIPSGVVEIGESAFAWCGTLREITIPEGVEYINRDAFTGCSALKVVKLPSTLVGFEGFSHFIYCTSLDSIYIPQNVKKIPSDIFAGCTSLTRIIVDKRNVWYDSRNDCNAIIHSSDNSLIAGGKGSTIVEGVRSIAENAFLMSGVTSIHIPASVEYIDSTAFRKSENCKAITVDRGNAKYKSDGSNSIVERATNKMILACSTTKILPEVTSIGGYAYLNTSANVILPSGIKEIGNRAFADCKDLCSIFIPSTVKHIGRFAFIGCKYLSDVVLMGNDLVIDKQAFEGCDLIKK